MQISSFERPVAQGTIEYLVIVAVVVVIGLIVVFFASSFLGAPSEQIGNAAGSISAMSGPIGFVEAVADADGGAFFGLRNNTGDGLEITGIETCSTLVPYEEQLLSGDDKLFYLDGLDATCICTAVGQKKSLTVKVYATSSSTLEKNWEITLLVECVLNVDTDDWDLVVLSSGKEHVPPVVTLTSPASGYAFVSLPVDLNFTVSDVNSTIEWCKLYIDDSITDNVYAPILEGVNLAFRVSSLSSGIHQWKVRCMDGNNNIGWGGPRDLNYATTVVDTTPPVITLTSPANHTVDTDGNVDFNYTVSDVSGIQSCELILNGLSVVTNSSAPFTGFHRTLPSSGVYIWDVNCIDNSSSHNEETDINSAIDVNYFVTALPPIEFAGGNGSLANPYQISDCNQMQNMNLYLDANYVLINDINCDITPFNTGSGFEPIGYCGDDNFCSGFFDNNSFSGTFDGAGFEINGLYINRPAEYGGSLFSSTKSSSVLKNVGFIDANINSKTYSAALASYHVGTINDVYVVRSNISSPTGAAAGIVYYMQSTNKQVNRIRSEDNNIIAASVSGGVFGTLSVYGVIVSDINSRRNKIICGSTCGGAFGSGDATITRFASTDNNIWGNWTNGNIGGLGGANNGSVSNSYSKNNTVFGAGTGSNGTGGFFGFAGSMVRISDSFASDNNIRGTDNVGGFIGLNWTSIENCYSSNNNVYASGSGSGGFVGEFDSGWGEIVKSYAARNFVYGGSSGRVGTFAGEINSGAMNNLFSSGSVYTSSSYKDGFGYYSGGAVSDLYWNDTNFSDSVNSTSVPGCITEYLDSNFYNMSHSVYVSGMPWSIGDFGTDSNWSNVCDGFDFPKLMWENKNLGDCLPDPDLDFIAGTSIDQPDRVYLNGGSADFTLYQSFGAVYSYGIGIGDLDNDGDLDAVVVTKGLGSGGPQREYVYKNNGAGSFSQHTTSTLLDYTDGVGMGDFDGDGDLDFITANSQGPNRVYLNDGSGYISLYASSVESDSTGSIGVGDFDGDGDLDYIAGNSGLDRVYINDGSANFSLGSWVATESNGTRTAVGDFDGDGDIDYLSSITNGKNRVYLNNGSANFSVGSWEDSVANNYTYALAVGDLDFDGDLDFIAGRSSATNNVYLNDGSANFTLYDSSVETKQTWALGIGDFDGDGDLDYVAGNLDQTNDLYLNNGSGDFSLKMSFPIATDHTISIGVGDLDGDGNAIEFDCDDGVDNDYDGRLDSWDSDCP